MLAAAFILGGSCVCNRLGLAGPARRYRRIDATVDRTRDGVYHIPRKPIDLGCGNQLSRGGFDGGSCASDWFGQGGRTPQLSGGGRLTPIDLPFAQAVADVPIIGQIYAELISGHTILVYLALAFVPFTWWLLNRTRFGLRLRAVGENPAAVDTAGVSVIGLRYAAVAICGVLCGIAGAYLATALQAGFTKDMSAGRGFIALAALIFAKWRPWHALGATLLFGFLQAISLRPDVIEAVLGFKIQIQLLDALPYILTVVILAGFVGRAVPPRAGGAPYVKER